MFKQTEEWVNELDLGISPSELHGIICGQIVVHPEYTPAQWVSQFIEMVDYEGQLSEDYISQLNKLYQQTSEKLTQQAFDFTPLLPEEDTTVEEQVNALAAWCRGFLLSFGLGGAKIQDLSAQSNEILQDMIKMTEVYLEEGQADVEASDHLMELIEYTRMATLFLFMDINEQ